MKKKYGKSEIIIPINDNGEFAIRYFTVPYNSENSNSYPIKSVSLKDIHFLLESLYRIKGFPENNKKLLDLVEKNENSINNIIKVIKEDAKNPKYKNEYSEVYETITKIENAVKNKIAFTGIIFTGGTDLGRVPVDSLSPNVLVHLNALNNILMGDFILVLGAIPGILIIFLTNLGLGTSMFWVRKPRGVAIVGFSAIAGFILLNLIIYKYFFISNSININNIFSWYINEWTCCS